MKKLVAALAAGVIVAGTTVTSVSAESYDVKEGDSLWTIAQQNNTTVDELVEINELKSTTIQPNQEIAIDNENVKDNEKYEVEKGDTLGGISKEHDTTVVNLKEWNNLKSDLIITGQTLNVNGPQAEDEKTVTTDETASTDEATSTTDEATSTDEEASTTDEKAEPKQEKQEEPKKEATNEQTKDKSSEEESSEDKSSEGKTISVEATAYTGDCEGCSGVTSTGVDLNADPNAKVIAVDPDVIPLGTKVHVEGYGEATAADTGGAINGNKIDVHVPSKGEADSWGVKTVNVTIVD